MKRLLGFARDLLRGHALDRGVPAPFKLTFVVTDECSCRCAICLLWKAPRRGPTTSEIEALFRSNPQLSWINLSGGEVAERTDFGAIVEAAVRHTRVAALDFPTAGQRPDAVVSAVQSALRTELPRLFVTVSIDGPPTLHDALRGTPHAFERAIDTIDRLRAIDDPRLAVYVGLTFSSRNDADPEQVVTDLLAAAPRLRREDLHFNVAHHSPHYYRNRPGDSPDATRVASFLRTESERRARSIRPFDWLERAYWQLAADFLTTGRTPMPCSALGASAYVDPDLTVYPCATWDHPLGNLRDHGLSLSTLLARTEARAARSDARSLRCPNCFTPCEAYPMMLTQRAATLEALLASGGHPTRGEPVAPHAQSHGTQGSTP